MGKKRLAKPSEKSGDWLKKFEECFTALWIKFKGDYVFNNAPTAFAVAMSDYMDITDGLDGDDIAIFMRRFKSYFPTPAEWESELGKYKVRKYFKRETEPYKDSFGEYYKNLDKDKLSTRMAVTLLKPEDFKEADDE